MTVPMLHPNGFIQLDLPSGKRLHVWHPNLPIAQKVHTPFHDHTFTFKSTILLGNLIHEEKETWLVSLGGTHVIHAVQGPDLVSTGLAVIADFKRKVSYKPGDSYTFGGPGKYHDSRGIGLTATLMEKLETNLADHATVLVPLGERPDNDFRRDQYPAEVLMPYVWEAVDQVFSPQLNRWMQEVKELQAAAARDELNRG